MKCDSGAARRLCITLRNWVAGNAVLVKLVDQENLMAAFEAMAQRIGSRGMGAESDSDERREPNISVSHVMFNGCQAMLPDGVALSC